MCREGPKAAEVGRGQTGNGYGCPAEDLRFIQKLFCRCCLFVLKATEVVQTCSRPAAHTQGWNGARVSQLL